MYDAAAGRIRLKRGAQRVAAQENHEDALKEIEIFREEYFKAFAKAIPDAEAQLIKCFEPSWFGVVQDSLHSIAEPEGLGSVRVLVEGTRMVTTVPLFEILNMMKDSGVPTQSLTMARACHYLKTISDEGMAALCSKVKVHHGTVGVGEGLYVPVGHCVVEVAQGGMDAVGLCLRGAAKSTVCHEQLVAMHGLSPMTPIGQRIKDFIKPPA